MFRGLYTAVSAMQTTQRKLDIASNNMANLNTTGFKKDVIISEAFPEVFLQKINGNIPVQAVKNNLQVQVERDGEGFNLSTDGGFFSARSSAGISYSRTASFMVDEEGYLRTYGRDIDGKADPTEGNYILDRNGNPVLADNPDIQINTFGQVVVNGQVIADLVTRPGFNTIGTINSGLRVDRIQTYFTQGNKQETGNPLDLSIKGTGFFKVHTSRGEMYTRNGSFTLNENGQIVTAEGYFLAGQSGPIVLDNRDFQIGRSGEIIVEGEAIDQIDLINIVNVNSLKKHGEGYFYIEEGTDPEIEPFEAEVLQGFLESSNVHPVDEMVEMVNILRAYESNQRIVRAYDEILQKAVNDIGRV